MNSGIKEWQVRKTQRGGVEESEKSQTKRER